MLNWVFLLTFILNFGWAADSIEEGIALYQNRHYQEALNVFKQAEGSEQEQLRPLIGQLFCHIALGETTQIDPTLQLITAKFQGFTDCDTPPKQAPLTLEQQHMSYLCRRHIREVANRMRQTVEQLVRESVPGIFEKIKVLRQLYPFIDSLEQTGIGCCENNFPLACCLDPLLLQLETWNSFGLKKPQ